jgi:glycosyltransferase involved in cell wall biosynthesis
MTLTYVAMESVLATSWLLAFGWLYQAIAAWRGVPRIPDLTRKEPCAQLDLDDSPHLSVLVPACNEEETIQTTLRSLLASTGIRLQIIAVNDRSTDRTGALMDEIAAQAASGNSPHSLVVIHNRELPQGWLGKPHALSLALQRATAPWILLTDADPIFAPRALELGLRQAIAERADHLVLLATLISEQRAEAATAAIAQALSQWSVRLWRVSDPKARDSFGMGCSSFVRADALRDLGGFAALRMQVVEDLALGAMIKRAGYRSHVAMGLGLISIRWVRGLFGLVRNCEKNGFAVFHYSIPLTVLACLGFAGNALLPLVAIAAGRWGMASFLLTYLGVALVLHANRRMNRVSPLVACFFAPAAAIIGFAFLRSMLLTLERDGVDWRGTHYLLSALRKHAIRWP